MRSINPHFTNLHTQLTARVFDARAVDTHEYLHASIVGVCAS